MPSFLFKCSMYISFISRLPCHFWSLRIDLECNIFFSNNSREVDCNNFLSNNSKDVHCIKRFYKNLSSFEVLENYTAHHCIMDMNGMGKRVMFYDARGWNWPHQKSLCPCSFWVDCRYQSNGIPNPFHYMTFIDSVQCSFHDNSQHITHLFHLAMTHPPGACQPSCKRMPDWKLLLIFHKNCCPYLPPRGTDKTQPLSQDVPAFIDMHPA